METACVDGHSHISVIGSYRPGPYPHKGKGVCVRDACAIYDNNISPSLLMIIIKIIILYFTQIRHTDDFPPTGTLLVWCKNLALNIRDVSLCLSDGTLKSRWSFLSGIYARGSKRSHQSTLEMCNVSWTPSNSLNHSCVSPKRAVWSMYV